MKPDLTQEKHAITLELEQAQSRQKNLKRFPLSAWQLLIHHDREPDNTDIPNINLNTIGKYAIGFQPVLNGQSISHLIFDRESGFQLHDPF